MVDHVKAQSRNNIPAEELNVIGEFNRSHPINVLNLSIALGMKLGYEDERLNDIAIAALLHDIGFNLLPHSITQKPYYRLTHQEKHLFNLHPIYSAKIIAENIKLEKHISETILHHQEFMDGTGYPQGLFEDQINYNSYAIGVACIYDRIINQKLDNLKRTPQQVIKKILIDYNRKYPPVVLHSFVHLFNFSSSDTFQNSNEWIKSVS